MSEVERIAGITVRADRLAGSEGTSGEIVVRRGEVVAVSVGTAALTELPWVEGIAGALLAVVTAFLLSARGTSGQPRGALAAVLLGSAAVALLARTFYRRGALVVTLATGDRRKLWIEGPVAERAKLVAALRRGKWPVTT